MTDWYEDVMAFHEKFGCWVGKRPETPPGSNMGLRMDLLAEEFAETERAWMNDDLVQIADGLADMIYVAIGMAITYGIDLRPVWREVHRSNMAKEGGAMRADGKILKPAGWTAPDVKGILELQGME